MAKIKVNTLSENGAFKDVNKLIELFTKAENGKPLKVKDYNLLTIIGIEKLLTYDDIDRITSTLASLEENTVENRDFIQSSKVVENLQITLVQPKSDGTKELLDMRWDYKGVKHNSAKEALDESTARIKSYVNMLYEETQDESLKEIADIIVDTNRALISEFSKILKESEDISYDLDRLKRQKENQSKQLDQIEQFNKEQDFLIKTIIDENKKNHSHVTEYNVINHSINNPRAKKGYLEVDNITGNTLKNLSQIEDDVHVLYKINDFENSNEHVCNNEQDILVGLKEIEGRTLINYNKEKDIIPKIKYPDIIGNTEDLKNTEPGYMQLESITGNTMTNLATIKDDTIITHQFNDLKGNNDEFQDISDGTIYINKITGNTMTNISKSKHSFEVTHSFNDIENGVSLPLVNSKDNSHLRIGVIEGKTLENLVLEPPRHMILNDEIKESFEDSIIINNTVEGGELDLIIEGHTAVNLSKIKELTPVTYKYDDIIGNESVLNSIPGTLEIDRIEGNTLINKVIADPLLEIDLKDDIVLEPNSMYQVSFDIDKDCDNYTFTIGNHVFNHPLKAGRNEFTLYMKEEPFIGKIKDIVFTSDNNAIISELEIYKGGQEILFLNEMIDIKEATKASILDTVELGRVDIELIGNTLLNISKTKEETIVIDSSEGQFEGNSGEIESNSETIEISSIKGLTYRNMLDQKIDLQLFSVGLTHTFNLAQDVSPNTEYTVCCTSNNTFTVIIDDIEYLNVSNGTFISTPEKIKNYTFIVRSETEETNIDNLMLLEGAIINTPSESFLGVMSTFESEKIKEDDITMYKIEISTSNEEELSTETYLLNEPLRSVFEYSDEITYDDTLQELIVNRAVSQIKGSEIDRNVLCSSQVGLHVDFTKDDIEYERLGDAIGRVPGRDFNHLLPWAGMRKVAINTLTGEKVYYNEEGYTEDGSIGSIFTEIPKFYYKVDALETEDYFNDIIKNITERNLINWKLSYASGKLESSSSDYHKTTNYYEYDKIKPLTFIYDSEKFKIEVVFFNMTSSLSYPTYEQAPDVGKFRVCFEKLDGTEFTTEDIQYLIATSKVNEFRGKHINKANWWVSTTLENDYKIHPAFVRNGKEMDYIYVASYESSGYNTSSQTFIIDDSNIDVEKDYLVSRNNSYPITGFGKNMTLLNNRRCANRAKAHLFDLTSLSAIQLLFLLEYASFDTQKVVGDGIVDLSESTTVSYSTKTGATSKLIDRTGECTAVAYRGIENLWGNTWSFIDGANLYNDSMTTIYWSNEELDLSTAEGYSKINASSPNIKGHIRRFGFDENNSFVFVPSDIIEDDYIGETYEQKETSGWRVFLSGGAWSSNKGAGLYSSKQDNGTATTNLTIGTRLLYY